jgi:tRNA wybutosine-synthesizing protein 4
MDMRNTKLLEAFLKAIDDFSDSTPTFLLSEVVLTYMAVNSCNGVIQWIAEVLSDCVVTIYEQINPHDGFGQVMCSHFKKLGSPLKCILKYPTELDQINRYKQAVCTL